MPEYTDALLLLLVFSCFFGLLALFRNAVHLGFLDRPLVMGILFALVLEPPSLFLGIAIFFELLWLDCIPAGTYIPPQSQLAAFVCAEMAALLHVSQPGQMLPLLLLAIPIAWLGSRVESAQRRRQNSLHDLLLRCADSEGMHCDPQPFVLRTLLSYAGIQAGICLISSLCLYPLAVIALRYWPASGAPGWPLIWGSALLGSILALRLRKAYYLLAVSLVVIFIPLWMGIIG